MGDRYQKARRIRKVKGEGYVFSELWLRLLTGQNWLNTNGKRLPENGQGSDGYSDLVRRMTFDHVWNSCSHSRWQRTPLQHRRQEAWLCA
jgi:hypothetical protein